MTQETKFKVVTVVEAMYMVRDGEYNQLESAIQTEHNNGYTLQTMNTIQDRTTDDIITTLVFKYKGN